MPIRAIFIVCVLASVSGCERIVEEASALQARLLPTTPEDPVDAAIGDYQTVERIGDKVSICARAGLVVEALLAAGDDEAALEWREVQAKDCETAGIPAI